MEKDKIISVLDEVMDPEIPVLSIRDLGILRDVDMEGDDIVVTITPTYSGCPAMDMIKAEIRETLARHGFQEVTIRQRLSPAWTTDWMTGAGKKKLEAFGIAPPALVSGCAINSSGEPKRCPVCHGEHVELISLFGSTACKALYRCLDCGEPFDYFKCH